MKDSIKFLLVGIFLITLGVVEFFALKPDTLPGIVTNIEGNIDLSCPRCNVIFLNIELLRADHTGLIGNTTYTPAIDRFFRNSIVFHNMSSPGGETFLSNTAVQTGIRPHELDISGLDVDQLSRSKSKSGKFELIHRALTSKSSFSEILQKHGYHTIGINQGGRAGSGVFLDRGVDDYTQWPKKAMIDDMIDQVRQTLNNTGQQPFYFLFRPTFLHNHQYRLTQVPEWLDRLKIIKRPFTYQTPENKSSHGYHLKRNKKVSEAGQRRMERAIYRAQLEHGDKQLDRLFGLLTRLYIKNSIIVLYSNHGSGLGDNDIYEHGTSYQSSIHVPLLIRHPKLTKPIHIHTPTSLFDLVPSISKMIGVDEPRWAMLETYQETISRGQGLKQQPIIGKNSWDEYIRIENWKYIVLRGSKRMLFNLAYDPHEEKNLILDYPQKAAELEVMLKSYKHNIRKIE